MAQLNPIQQRVANGMPMIQAIFTDATCGEACWEAREDICRCSCGGKNHGCMRTADGTRPTRTAKIDGYRYELKAVDINVSGLAKEINNRQLASVDRITDTMIYHYHWKDTDKGSPARVKRATKQQVATWPELRSFKEHLEAIQSKPHCGIDILRAWPELLWVLQDEIPTTRYRGFSSDQLKAYLDKQSTQSA